MGRCMFILFLLSACILIQDSRCDKRRISSKHRYIHRKVQRTSFHCEENLHFFKDYRRYHQIEEFIKGLRNCSTAKVFSIGKSVEGRNLSVIKIGSSYKPAIWIDGGIHAREWISPATVTYIAYKLVTKYGKRFYKNENNILFEFSWYILPLVNPDGYEYSHQKDRMWRKNRNSKNDTCPGVDLNRNWGFHWNEGGASQDPCSDVYSGESAFSEPETRAIAKFLLRKMLRQGIVAFLTFHSYGQAWLYPWGWSESLPDGYLDLDMVAKKTTGAMNNIYRTGYSTGSVSRHFKSIASGGSDDWARGEAGIKYSYTVELPDKRKYGFKLPKKYILPTAREVWEGIKAFSNAIYYQN